MPDTGDSDADHTTGKQAAVAPLAEEKEQSLMVRLRNLTLKSKLLLMLLPIGIVSMGIQGILGHFSGTKAQIDQAFESMIAVRQSKKQQIENLFRSLHDPFPIFGDDVAVVSAMSQFRDAFAQLGRTRLDPARRFALEEYYRKTLMPSLTVKSPPNEPLLYENLWPRTDRSIEAQALFIAENKFPMEERSKFVDHPVSNPYTLAHYTYHIWFRDVMQRLKLYDLMLVDSDTGGIVYSVEKEVDFGTSLLDGPYANSNLGRLFRRVLAEHRKGYVAFSDFETYVPSRLAPAMFLATPVYSNFKLIGVLVGQVSIAEINRTLNGNNSWQQDGLGKTGGAYITGPSLNLRSDLRAFIEDKKRFSADLKAQGVADATIANILRGDTTILRLQANVEAAERARRGETGTMIGRNVLQERSIQAYAPLSLPDLNWSLVAEIKESEVLAAMREFQKNMMILACALALATALASTFLASRFLRPVNRLLDSMAALRAGKTTDKIETNATDEFGTLTTNFNEMAAQIKERNARIAEKTEGNTLLLKRLFPASIVDRMVKGESQIVDMVPNVTVIYASVIGFIKAIDGKTPPESMTLLNEIFDLIDEQAAEHGIDRVKTLGEHYIAACGLTEARLDHAQRSVAFCDAVSRELHRMALQKNITLDLRAALASGDIHAGLVGDRRFVFEIWGRPLNYARRLIHDTAINEVRITDATAALLGNASGFTERPPVDGRTLGQIRNLARPMGDDTIVGSTKSALGQAAE